MKGKILLLCLLLSSILFCQNEPLKKITFLKSNNQPIEDYYKQLSYPENIDDIELKKLKKYILKNSNLKFGDEPGFFLDLMNWVSNQWDHDGWNKAPDSLSAYDILKNVETGIRYRCVEYGKVLKEALQAFGYISRGVGLRSVDAAYGGAGRGHVATEVWSNKLQKWIFLDPQFSIYAKYEDKPLSYYDLYKLKSENKFDDIQFIILKGKNTTKAVADYKSFIKNYFGYISIPQKKDGLKYSLLFKMEAESDHITFQGFPTKNLLFTENCERVYFKLNQTNVFFDFTKEEYKRTEKVYAGLNIKTLEAFNSNMHKFAAKPNLTIKMKNNMPWFKNYFVELNSEKIKVKNDYCEISLKTGKNRLKVWSVNKAGVKGVETNFIINYE